LLLGAAIFGAPSAWASQEGVDVVYLRDGSAESGEVLGQTFRELTFTPEGGSKKSVSWSEVQSVAYGDAPDELATGEAMLGAGNLEGALEQLKVVAAAEDLRPFVLQQGLFLMGHVHQRLGQGADAIEAYHSLLSDASEGRYLLPAGESLIALHLAAGDAGKAQAAFDELKASLQGKSEAEPALGLLEAGLLAGSGKSAEALERYRQVGDSAGADPALLDEARLGHARMLLKTGKAAEAEPLLRALVKDSPSARAQSGAWNALGEMQTAAGFTKKNGDQIRDGLFSYMRTVVQYKPLPGESTSDYERALAGASECFQYLSDLEQNAEVKRLHQKRKSDLVEQLQREYPNSPYLRRS
jgi:hypothetical protein